MSLEDNLRISFNSRDNRITQEIIETPSYLFQKKINKYYPGKVISILSVSFLFTNIFIIILEKTSNLEFKFELDNFAFVLTNQYVIVVSLSNIIYGLIAFISSI